MTANTKDTLFFIVNGAIGGALIREIGHTMDQPDFWLLVSFFALTLWGGRYFQRKIFLETIKNNQNNP